MQLGFAAKVLQSWSAKRSTGNSDYRWNKIFFELNFVFTATEG
jgi:hypothetical protein